MSILNESNCQPIYKLYLHLLFIWKGIMKNQEQFFSFGWTVQPFQDFFTYKWIHLMNVQFFSLTLLVLKLSMTYFYLCYPFEKSQTQIKNIAGRSTFYMGSQSVIWGKDYVSTVLQCNCSFLICSSHSTFDSYFIW